jgi:hypothetical protein
MTRPEPDPAAAAVEPADPADDAGADELLEPELLQAAVSSATPSASASPAPSRIDPDARIPTDALIVTVSRLLAFCRHSDYDRGGEPA